MGLSHSPSVVTRDLIFYYDASNTNKSWKGAPTTNVVTNASTMTGWSNYYRTVTSSTFTTEFGTTGYRFINQPSWNGILRSITLPATGTYTFSARVRYLGGSTSNNGATVYVSGWGGADSFTAIDKTKIGVWQDISLTLNCTNTTMTFYLISFGGTDNGTGNPDYSSWEVTMPQIEAGSSATPFVAGTRSNTQVLLDLTNNNTLAANSLTYASNNTFSFNGSSNLLTLPENSLFNTQTPTVEVWVKTNALVQNGFFFEKGNVNTQYSLFQEGSDIVWRTHTGTSFLSQLLASSNIDTTNYWQIVGTIEGGNKKIYINGVEKASTAWANTLPTNPNGCSIGAYGGSNGARGYYFNGKIDVVKVYSRGLTAAEIMRNFNALRGRYGI